LASSYRGAASCGQLPATATLSTRGSFRAAYVAAAITNK
jgi:hypothetical protein